MGMAASQARFLGLTARKTNVEYEGQQVNQQRTCLANQSANYYNQLLGMTVPTPPSVQDFTKTVYTFTDGALNNTITSLIAQPEGNFLVSYTRSYTDTNAVVATSSSIVTRKGNEGNYSYSVGAKDLRELGVRPSAEFIANDPYLSTLNEKDLDALFKEEALYKDQLEREYNTGKEADWLVYYRLDTTSGTYNPVFYKKNDLEKESTIYSDSTGASQSFIPAYTIGSTVKTDEMKGVKAQLEKDASGRFINITLDPGTDEECTYALTANTTTDQQAYNDAMNQYEFDKATYDKAVQDINVRIKIIQEEDKNLELRLKQLDTEQDAISTEMDAVQKVIEKNTESTFKTFG